MQKECRGFVLETFTAKNGPSRFLSPVVDVTKPAQVHDAFVTAKEKFGGVDVVFSNAGTASANEVQDAPDDKARQMFEVNFWGTSNIIKESIKLFRDMNEPGKGSRLLRQMTSIAGIGSWGSLGYYCASKHAVAGLAKTIAQELKLEWKFQVTVIEPGFFRTALMSFIQAEEAAPTDVYAGGVAAHKRELMAPENIQGDPEKAMQLVKQVAEMDQMPLHLPIGEDAIDFFRSTSEDLRKGAED